MLKLIKKWLGITQLEYQRQVLQVQLAELNDKIKLLTEVAIDYHEKSPSWAVICLRGKPETVKFIQLDTKTIMDIRRFLSQFTKNEPLIDHPMGMYKEVFWP